MGIRYLPDLMEIPNQEWYWRGFLGPRNMTLLSAHPKAGKTTFTFHLLQALWTREEHLALPMRPVPVLYITEEADTTIRDRCKSMGFSEMWPIGWVTPEPGRTWAGTINYMQQYVNLFPNSLIVLDTLSRHWGLEDENSASQVEGALKPLTEFIRSSTASLLCIHHLRKSGGAEGLGARGSSALGASFDVLMELSRITPWDNSPRRRIEALSRYGDTPTSMTIELTDRGYVSLAGDEEGVGIEKLVVTTVLRMESATATEVAKELDVSERYCREVLARMHARGVLVRTGQGTKRSEFRYSAAPPPDLA